MIEPWAVLLGSITTGIIVSLIAPWVLGRQAGGQRLAEKEQEAENALQLKREEAETRARERREDWARQDAVAAAATAAADKVANTLIATNDLAANERKDIRARVDQVHTLVNDNLTTAIKRERKAVARALELLQTIAEPTPVELAEIESQLLILADLDKELAAREAAKQAAIIDRANTERETAITNATAAAVAAMPTKVVIVPDDQGEPPTVRAMMVPPEPAT